MIILWSIYIWLSKSRPCDWKFAMESCMILHGFCNSACIMAHGSCRYQANYRRYNYDLYWTCLRLTPFRPWASCCCNGMLQKIMKLICWRSFHLEAREIWPLTASWFSQFQQQQNYLSSSRDASWQVLCSADKGEQVCFNTLWYIPWNQQCTHARAHAQFQSDTLTPVVLQMPV